MHPFDGHRVYNGCPDSTLQAKWDAQDAALVDVQKLEPDARCCWFPVECMYSITVMHSPFRELAWESDKTTACRSALAVLRGDC